MSSLNDYIRFALDIEDHNIVFKDYFYKILIQMAYTPYISISTIFIFLKFSMVLNIKFMRLSSFSQPVLFVAQLVWFITDTLRSTYAISLLMLVSLS